MSEEAASESENERLRRIVLELEQKLAEQQRTIASHRRLENQVLQLNVLTAELKSLSRRLAKARDQAVDASRVKSQFLANMSHEIRTPMNALIGVSDLLMKTNLTKEQNEYGQMIKDAATNLLGIVNDVLDFSKIEAGKSTLEFCDLDLVTLIEGSAELLADKAREKKLSLMTFVQPQIPRLLRADSTKLRQILLNLISNALKFTHKGEVLVHAKLDRIENEYAYVRILVRDSGIGIEPKALEQIFSPFTQADNSISRKYGGTGLGLSICKRLVELMNGELHVDSAPGQGSTFSFIVPMELPQNAVQTDHYNDFPQDLRMLMVDGPNSATKVVQSYCLSWGIDCDTTDTARECLNAMEQAAKEGKPYRYVLIETQMQDMSSEQFCHEFSSNNNLSNTKLILFNPLGTVYSPKLSECLSAYLTTPLKQAFLYECLKNLSSANHLIEQAEVTQPAPATEEQKPLDQHKILIAEDNLVNQKVAILQLNHLGYSAQVVSNGEEAVTAVRTSDFDLILMDCQMPVMDGFEATKEIRKLEIKTGKHVPIVAMTAHAMEGDRERCIAEGMDDYLSKPVNPKILDTLIQKWLYTSPPAAPAPVPLPLPLAANPPEERAPEQREPEQDPPTPLKRQWKPGSEPPIDLSVLHQLCGETEVDRMIELYLSTNVRLLKNLNFAIQDHDMIGIKGYGHELKGACAAVGANEVAKLAGELERTALEKNWTQCKILFEAIRQSIELVEDYHSHKLLAAT